MKIEIVDLRLPPQIQPEDKFRTVAEITGEGLAGQKLDVTLEITHIRTVQGQDQGQGRQADRGGDARSRSPSS